MRLANRLYSDHLLYSSLTDEKQQKSLQEIALSFGIMEI